MPLFEENLWLHSFALGPQLTVVLLLSFVHKFYSYVVRWFGAITHSVCTAHCLHFAFNKLSDSAVNLNMRNSLLVVYVNFSL